MAFIARLFGYGNRNDDATSVTAEDSIQQKINGMSEDILPGDLRKVNMMTHTHRTPSSDQIPQTKPLNKRQVVNEAGGYSFKVCDMTQLKRFLVIGTESGTYYTNTKDLTIDSIKCVMRLLEKGHAVPLLDILEEYSKAGRVAKEDPLLLALALCATYKDPKVQKAAYERVPNICNIPTKLFHFLDLCQGKINAQRQSNPPKPQPNKKRKAVDSGMADLSLTNKQASEDVDSSINPIPSKKLKRMEKRKAMYKTVNKTPKKSSGWGRMRRKGIGSFYTDPKKDADRLLYLLTKYKQRHDWSHKQVLGYAHPKMTAENEEEKTAKDLVLSYATRGYSRFEKNCAKYKNADGKIKAGISDLISGTIGHIEALEAVIKLNPENEGDVDKLLGYMRKFGVRDHHSDVATQDFGCDVLENPHGRRSSFQIVREHIPTAFLKDTTIWSELLKDMPMTAMIRNLGKMSSMGLFEDDRNVEYVREALTNAKRLQAARVHPIKIMIALMVYKKGCGEKGNLAWPVNQDIKSCLERAFYLSFTDPAVKHLFKTGKRYMLCLDVSGSMTWQGCYGCELITPAMAAAAMSLVTLNIEDHCEVMAFGGRFQPLPRFSKDLTLEGALSVTSGMNFGPTDCSLPMIYASKENKDVDVFIVYTDSDTWAGNIHPPEALNNYNKKMGKQSKLIVCAMQSNGFTIADPENRNMMDMCGFDTNVPEIIAEFARGNLSGKCDVCVECKK